MNEVKFSFLDIPIIPLFVMFGDFGWEEREREKEERDIGVVVYGNGNPADRKLNMSNTFSSCCTLISLALCFIACLLTTATAYVKAALTRSLSLSGARPHAHTHTDSHAHMHARAHSSREGNDGENIISPVQVYDKAVCRVSANTAQY